MTPSGEHLLQRVERYGVLATRDREALLGALAAQRFFAPSEDLLLQGAPSDGVTVIVEGFACRYRLLPDGRRQIVGYLLPGDMCDLGSFLLRRMDHSVGALGAVTTSALPRAAVARFILRRPLLTRALWWTTLVDDSITREWVVNVGQRSAFERMAHLFCEIFWRLEAVGLTRDNRCDLPMTQIELADTLALSAVHVNRTLMYMRRVKLVALGGRHLVLQQRAALEQAAGFDPAYLHLDGGSLFAPGQAAYADGADDASRRDGSGRDGKHDGAAHPADRSVPINLG